MNVHTSGRAVLVGFALVVLIVGSARGQEPDPERTLTVSRAIELALSGNANLKAVALEARSDQELYRYAGKPSNPGLEVELEDVFGSGPFGGTENAETTVAIVQSLELGGKRRARRDVARAQHLASELAVTQERRAITAVTILKLIHVAADQERYAVSTRIRDLTAEGLSVAKRRVRSGGASKVEVRRAEIALARSDIVAEHAEHELRASRRRLAALWAEAELDYDHVDLPFYTVSELPSFATLTSQVDANPEIAKLERERALQQAVLRQEKGLAIPDLRISAGGRRSQSVDANGVVFGLSIPLPMFERNRGQIRGAHLKVRALEAQTMDMKARVQADLYTQFQELVHARTELETLEQQILPNARDVLQLVSAGFTAGRFSQIELLEAQRTLGELELERIDVAERIWGLTIAIQLKIGTDAVDLAATHRNGVTR